MKQSYYTIIKIPFFKDYFTSPLQVVIRAPVSKLPWSQWLNAHPYTVTFPPLSHNFSEKNLKNQQDGCGKYPVQSLIRLYGYFVT